MYTHPDIRNLHRCHPFACTSSFVKNIFETAVKWVMYEGCLVKTVHCFGHLSLFRKVIRFQTVSIFYKFPLRKHIMKKTKKSKSITWQFIRAWTPNFAIIRVLFDSDKILTEKSCWSISQISSYSKIGLKTVHTLIDRQVINRKNRQIRKKNPNATKPFISFHSTGAAQNRKSHIISF